jgi:hypothetical protein
MPEQYRDTLDLAERTARIGPDHQADGDHGVVRKGYPVWLLIGLLWLSTALITLGAVTAFARLVG